MSKLKGEYLALLLASREARKNNGNKPKAEETKEGK